MDPRRNQHQLFACDRLSPDSFLTIPHLFEKCKPFFKIFQKIFSALQAAPKVQPEPGIGSALFPHTANAGCLSSSRRKFRAVRPVPEPGIGSALFPHTANAGCLSSSRRKFRAVRPVPEPGIGSALFPHTANAGCLSSSRRKFRAVRPVPEPGMGSALFPPPQTRAAYLPHAESFAPPRRVRGSPGPQAQKNSRPIGRLLLVLANTYLPGPSPAKYFRHERA